MFTDYVERVVEGGHLTATESYEVASMLLRDGLEEVKVASLLVALRTRREDPDELFGFATALREHAVTINAPYPTMDTCGTGGDRLKTLNISTVAALVVASCGVPVAKHGNRAMTGTVGSADVMEAMGVRIDLTPVEALRMLETVGFTFLYAPAYHPALRRFSGLRRKLGIPTMFNLMGPLINPCPLAYQMVGVASADAQATVAAAIARMGRKRALVVRGEDGLDEVSPCANTRVHDVAGGQVSSYCITPEDVGVVDRPDVVSLRGGDATFNARMTIAVLEGVPGPFREAVVANAAPALVAAEAVASLEEGVFKAREAIDSGKALDTLKKVIKASRDDDLRC